jgi:hypothetical protein
VVSPEWLSGLRHMQFDPIPTDITVMRWQPVILLSGAIIRAIRGGPHCTLQQRMMSCGEGSGTDGWEELIRHLPPCSHETAVVCLPALWSTFPGYEDLRCLLYLSLHCEGQHSGQTMGPAGYAILDLGQGHRTSAERYRHMPAERDCHSLPGHD